MMGQKDLKSMTMESIGSKMKGKIYTFLKMQTSFKFKNLTREVVVGSVSVQHVQSLHFNLYGFLTPLQKHSPSLHDQLRYTSNTCGVLGILHVQNYLCITCVVCVQHIHLITHVVWHMYYMYRIYTSITCVKHLKCMCFQYIKTHYPEVFQFITKYVEESVDTF